MAQAPSANSKLFSAAGAPLVLESRLGGGGEGAVYTVQGRPDVVAKIYSGNLSVDRQRKLAAQTGALPPPEVLQVTAWPTELVRSQHGIVGFLMPRAAQAEEAHALYGPKSRKQKFPDAGYKFLVHAAMNVARAFAMVHRHGIVVGDVNERVAMIARNGTVRLIDCDSFQIRSGEHTFRCEVGVPLFTPPELHSVTSLRGIERTEQHDLFGLAVLLFHLLFLGRHPYSGRNSADPGMTIETAIREHRFAYAADRRRTGMALPANAPALASAGVDIARLFEAAFAPTAAIGTSKRPGAADWADALQALQATLVECRQNAAHAYASSLNACPWCAIELKVGIELFNYVEPAGAAAAPVDVEAVWQAIEAIPLPEPLTAPVPHVVKEHLAPSPEALLIQQASSEQARIDRTRAERAAAEHEVQVHEQHVQAAEIAVLEARLSLDRFDADRLRLPELERRVQDATSLLDRYRWALYLAAPTTAAAPISLMYLDQMGGLVACVLVVCGLCALWSRRRRLDSEAHGLGRELDALRSSIALGPEPRKQRLAGTGRALAAAKQALISAQGKVYAAMLAETAAKASASARQADAELAKAAIQTRHQQATNSYNASLARNQALVAELQRLRPALQSVKAEAWRICGEINKIEARRKTEHRGARAESREAQLGAYLDRFFIMHEAWPRQLPKGTLAALSSFGIETAADISKDAVTKVPGFGPVRTALLLDWRKRKTAGFRFDPGKTEHAAKVVALDRRLDTERQQHERMLKKTHARMEAMATDLGQRQQHMARELADRARDLAQAIKDLEVAGIPGTASGAGSKSARSLSACRAPQRQHP